MYIYIYIYIYRILRAPPELAAQTLPAISKVLKNDYLAVGAVARNPRYYNMI